MIHFYTDRYRKSDKTLVQGLQEMIDDIESKGLDIISPYKVGNLALPRLHELAAAINRIRCDDWK